MNQKSECRTGLKNENIDSIQKMQASLKRKEEHFIRTILTSL